MSDPGLAKVLRVVLWAAFRPDEEISSRHIAVLFGIPATAVHGQLDHMVKVGALAREVRRGLAWYRAGPALLQTVRYLSVR